MIRYPESLFGSEKFTDDDANQAETDVDLHVGENSGIEPGSRTLVKI